VLDTHRHERLSWVAWEEGGKLPDVIIELVSPTTEAIDRNEKMNLYAQIWRTNAYFLYDRSSTVWKATSSFRANAGIDR
jgi:Uma2 family endonuclease